MPEPKYVPIEGTMRLAVAEEKEKYTQVLVNANEENRPMGLYCVSLKHERGMVNLFVIAESEEGAIQQVNDVPFKPCDYGYGASLLESGEMTAHASRIPMYIRGWGDNTY